MGKQLLSIFLWRETIYNEALREASELVHFRNRIGNRGMQLIFEMDMSLKSDSRIRI